MGIRLTFLSLLILLGLLSAKGQKQYIWEPKDYIPTKHPNVMKKDTVYLSFSDNRGIPSNSMIKCQPEKLINIIKMQLQEAYPSTVFFHNDDYYLKDYFKGYLNIKIGIQKYCATFSSGVWTGWTTFEVRMNKYYSNVLLGDTKSCSYNFSKGNTFGFTTAKMCLNQAYIEAFEDMCCFIENEYNTLQTKSEQLDGIRSGTLNVSEKRGQTKEQYVEQEILSRIAVSHSEIELTPKEIYKKYSNAVFLIYTSDGDQIAQGSGFIVSKDGIAVSNYHVFEGTYKGLETIKLPNGEIHKIKKVYGFSEKFDYIVFQLDGISFDYIPVNTENIEIGDEVYAIGSPRGLVNTISNGLISQKHTDFVYQISVPIDHGSSGGVLINKYGEAIGITSSGIDTSTANLNFALDIKSLFSKPF